MSNGFDLRCATGKTALVHTLVCCWLLKLDGSVGRSTGYCGWPVLLFEHRGAGPEHFLLEVTETNTGRRAESSP